jgi:hypothetical protein
MCERDTWFLNQSEKHRKMHYNKALRGILGRNKERRVQKARSV